MSVRVQALEFRPFLVACLAKEEIKTIFTHPTIL